MSTKILLLQQKDGLRQARSLVFGGAYFHSLALKDFEHVNDYLSRESVDVILADCRGAEGKGLEMVETLRKEQPKAKIVLVTETMDLPMVIKSIRLGVKDVFQGSLDLKNLVRSLGDLAASKETPAEQLRKADWTQLSDFFTGNGTPDVAPKAPPSAARRSSSRDATGDDAAERKALAEERERLTIEAQTLKKQAEEIEQKRQALADSERKLREGTRSPFGSGEEALRREREQLRLQVAELESERDLYLHQLEQKEQKIAELNAELARYRAGGAPAPAQLAPAPAPAPEKIIEKVVETVVETVVEKVVDMTLVDEARAEAARMREQLSQCESERDQVRGFLSAKEKALLQATATLQKLQAEATQFESRLREARQAKETGRVAEDASRADLEQARVQLASIEGERDFLRGQMTAMETELSVARDANDRLQHEIEDWRSRVESAEARVSSPSSATDTDWRREREQLLQKVAKLESERGLAREHLASKEKALGDANATVQKLKLELVQFEKRMRERAVAAQVPSTGGPEAAALEAELRSAQERLGMLELERDQARDQLTSRDAALALANATVESLREEIDTYAQRLRQLPAGAHPVPVADETMKAERDALRNRLARAESERDNARELLLAREKALKEANDALRRLRTETDIAAARSFDESTRRENEIAMAEERISRAQADLHTAQERLDEAWGTLRHEQTLVEERRRQLEDHAVALANRERLLAVERNKKVDTAGAEEIGAAERRLRLLRTELASLAAALNEREAALRTQEARVEQLLARADGDMRQVSLMEQQLHARSAEIEERISSAEKRAAEIISAAQSRAEAEERAREGLTEALRIERASVRKAEGRYLQACQEVGEQLQALADREALIRKREFQLDERENAIRGVLQRILSDASSLGRGERPAPQPSPDTVESAGDTLSKLEETRAAIEDSRRAFEESARRISDVAKQINL